MLPLAGKTILITGGNRGIGLAIGLRCADSANIVIIANEKSDAATEQIIAAGGNVLEINLDLTDDNAIDLAVRDVVLKFGGIDILINNAAAFHFTDTLNTSPKKFDLLFEVNYRATYFLSKACFPHLKIASNPHIVNISPPLDMDVKWFKNHLAFTMSKYAMSMCTLGMSSEFLSTGIAVNSLWPQTTIATTTIKDHFAPEVYAGSRWPTIMADAIYELVQRNSRQYTGQFFIDEDLLREIGITDFTKYAVNPQAPTVQDLFIPDKKSESNNPGIPLKKDWFV